MRRATSLGKLSATARAAREKKASGSRRYALVVGKFNARVTEGLRRGALAAFREHGALPKSVETFEAPGAFEIPLLAKALAKSGRFAGIVALGCVIRGETPHFEFVSLAATMGCLQASLDCGKPVAFGVLTVEDEAQAKARSAPDKFNKGREAVFALLETLSTLDRIGKWD